MSIKAQVDWVKLELPEVRIADGEAPIDKVVIVRGQPRTVKSYMRPIAPMEVAAMERLLHTTLRSEIENDPLNLGYAGKPAAAVAALLNTPEERIDLKIEDEMVDGILRPVTRKKRFFRESRVASIFKLLPFAPNAVTVEDVGEALRGQ